MARRTGNGREEGGSKASTAGERILWFEFLSQSSDKFQKRVLLNGIIADFYCKKTGLVILIGDKWDKADDFQKQGLTVLCFTEEEIQSTFREVCARINCQMKCGSLFQTTIL